MFQIRIQFDADCYSTGEARFGLAFNGLAYAWWSGIAARAPDDQKARAAKGAAGRSGMLAASIVAGLLAGSFAPAAASPWSDAEKPSAGPSRAIGSAANGCLAGGIALPADGIGYQAIRLSRRRFFGHRATVAFVERLGRQAAAGGLEPFYVGDMAQPRGGPMANGHAAHQNGLDVDIWFNLDPKPDLEPVAREDVPLWSVVLPDGSGIDPARFGPRQMQLLRLAAEDPAVDRIFVHWTIKRAMCSAFGRLGGRNRPWLARLRPWYGHDDHFHVRLRCPAGSPACAQQAAVPPGDGCDTSLDGWARLHLPSPLPSPPPGMKKPARTLPRECRLLIARQP